jgi:hypothetical protein
MHRVNIISEKKTKFALFTRMLYCTQVQQVTEFMDLQMDGMVLTYRLLFSPAAFIIQGCFPARDDRLPLPRLFRF